MVVVMLWLNFAKRYRLARFHGLARTRDLHSKPTTNAKTKRNRYILKAV